ncbi:hypothetical protein F3Y22_tig00014444pilonHSYRG00204 [Hibiscus syriacus]|uniref:Cytosolic endo-beta-N-acetylglucosaminidase TIM barrel domain-containing protein n=1 Tax=Hibiscus syriacus TaxID=106335 RepID=A0A6A3C211_HIBSY|nr:hypothetical protein F3Y22_tig00014444pilonHSYRG00204 [Hibiscus syriacus]
MALTNPPSRDEKANWSVKINLPHKNLKELKEKKLRRYKVLGTFITEWDEEKAICKELLSTKESTHKYSEHLVELVVALGFDGWMLNLEFQVDVGQISNLKEFVSHFTQTMHSLLPGSLVIWFVKEATD